LKKHIQIKHPVTGTQIVMWRGRGGTYYCVNPWNT
jgi:hypothetical protein